jgi:hypothetical protein
MLKSRLLYPTDEEVARLARMECDPGSVNRFTPISFGFLGNLVAVILTGCVGLIAALILVPVRLFRR